MASEQSDITENTATPVRRPTNSKRTRDMDDEQHEASDNSSSSSPASSSEEEPIVTLGGPKKPHIGQANTLLSGAQDLQSRLATLLPQLAAANADLALPGHDRNMENVEEGQQHIEMSLGLGVLEDKDGISSSSEESSSESESDRDDDEEQTGDSAQPAKRTPRKADVMDKLMGQKTADRQKAAIEEVG